MIHQSVHSHKQSTSLRLLSGGPYPEAREDSGDLGPGQTVPGTGGSGGELDAELFGPAVEVDRTGVVEVPAGALLYRVSRRETFDPESFLVAKPGLRQELLQERQSLWRQTVLQRLRDEQEILINNELVTRLDGA